MRVKEPKPKMGFFRSRRSEKVEARDKLPGREREPAFDQFRTDVEPTSNRCSAGRSLAKVRKPSRPIEHLDAVTHAKALLELMQAMADYSPGQMINFAELHKVYIEMCAKNHWRARAWVTVGREFDSLTTNGAKPYATFFDEDGRARRLRVYPIPMPRETGIDGT